MGGSANHMFTPNEKVRWARHPTWVLIQNVHINQCDLPVKVSQ